MYGVGKELAGGDRWPNWYEGNPFKAARDAMMKDKAAANGAPRGAAFFLRSAMGGGQPWLAPLYTAGASSTHGVDLLVVPAAGRPTAAGA
ncbi:hypothetical protein G6F23_014943 [Rhizopus arrhizus]|nr:hypothetical protein G6F23_014943 [Rhizopus arrhizus]